VYDDRLMDHYGVYGNDGAMWPRLGVRVPYEPMTFDDLKVQHKDGIETDEGDAMDGTECGVNMIGSPKLTDAEGENSRRFIANDAASREAHDVHSMAIPIITDSQRPWGWFPEDGPEAHTGSSVSEDSDDDDDDDGDVLGHPTTSAVEVVACLHHYQRMRVELDAFQEPSYAGTQGSVHREWRELGGDMLSSWKERNIRRIDVRNHR
jgi:hypothetical protein